MTINCKNMTQAMKAKKILEKNGIKSSVNKKVGEPYVGCIASLNFDDIYFDNVISLIKTNGILLHKSELYNDRDVKL